MLVGIASELQAVCGMNLFVEFALSNPSPWPVYVDDGIRMADGKLPRP